jgi:uncharacterized protein DUF4351
MLSHDHETHLLLFRNQPTLAADLIDSALGLKLPRYGQAQVISADLTDIQPAEYRADMVIQLSHDAAAVYGIIVEVQLSVDARKRFVWPMYAVSLRARLQCPVALLVVTADDAVARWAAQSVHLGGLNQFTPHVLGPSGIPEVTEDAQAFSSPELAVLSAMSHGHHKNPERAAEIASVARSVVATLDPDRSKIYLDLIMSSLSEAARAALGQMDARKYEYKSDFARHYVAQGRAEGIEQGRAEGRAALIVRMLRSKFGALDAEVEARIQHASIAELEMIGDRLLVARTLQDALAPRSIPM